jgi:hypothetical protein
LNQRFLPGYQSENNFTTSDHGRCSSLLIFTGRFTSHEDHSKAPLGFRWTFVGPCCDQSEIAGFVANSLSAWSTTRLHLRTLWAQFAYDFPCMHMSRECILREVARVSRLTRRHFRRWYHGRTVGNLGKKRHEVRRSRTVSLNTENSATEDLFCFTQADCQTTIQGGLGLAGTSSDDTIGQR